MPLLLDKDYNIETDDIHSNLMVRALGPHARVIEEFMDFNLCAKIDFLSFSMPC